MTIGQGTSLGSYTVLAPIGAGGMGEVYQARDTKLGRDVAIKVLPESLSKDEERLARFGREARVLASLNHPNIAAIYGLEDSDGVQFIVLELVDGQTLAERIARGPIPVDEVLPLFKQIAEALEAAHEKGIVHRDLKPANVKITPEGKVKVLDFGLAKALAGESTAPDQSESPTITRDGTATGVLLGTAPYMSPEQARGKSLDKRTDIWSFGCVLYEALTGKKVFEGETVTDTIANIVKSEPDWNLLPATTPWRARDLLARCLRKDPSQRLHEIGSARLDIQDAIADPTALETAVPVQPKASLWRRALPLVITGLLVGLAVWALKPSETSSPAQVKRVTVRLPPTDKLFLVMSTHSVEISPDGSQLVYFGYRNGVWQFFLRSMDSHEATPIRDTERAQKPFFSPDGRWIGFFGADRKLKKVPIAGGPAVTLSDASVNTYGAAWGPNDTIFFTVRNSGLWSIPAGGGDPEPVTSVDEELNGPDYRWPRILPDGKTILVTEWKDVGDPRIVAITANTGEARTLVEGGIDARFTPSGHLVFARAGSLLAVRLDPKSLEVHGPPVTVLDKVRVTTFGVADYALSRDGTLAYVTHELDPPAVLVRVERDGSSRILSEEQRFYHPRLSPSGDQVLVSIREEEEKSNSWIYDLRRNTLRRITFERRQTFELAPAIWTPDGKKVTFGAERDVDSPMQLYRMAADGSGEAEKLTSGGGSFPMPNSWSPDGKVLASTTLAPTRGLNLDVSMLSLDEEPKTSTFLETPFWESSAMFSPNGRWIAYISNESGRHEVYVRNYPGLGEKEQISNNGGTQPMWSRDGRTLYYRNGSQMMEVPIEPGSTLIAGQPNLLFEGDFEMGGPNFWTNYDVSPDSKSFIMIKRTTEPPRDIHVVLNWFEELKRLAPRN